MLLELILVHGGGIPDHTNIFFSIIFSMLKVIEHSLFLIQYSNLSLVVSRGLSIAPLSAFSTLYMLILLVSPQICPVSPVHGSLQWSCSKRFRGSPGRMAVQ